MRASFVVLLLFFTGASASGQVTQQSDKSVVEERPAYVSLVDPACAVVNARDPVPHVKEIRVLYFPTAMRAAIREPKSLVLHLVIENGFFQGDQRTLAFVRREDGVWVATVPVEERIPTYAVYWVEDGDTKQADTNEEKYFDVRFCGPQGQHPEMGVKYEALSYTGILTARGIDRPVDFAKAIAVLEEYIHPPDRGQNLMGDLWRDKLHLHGDTPEARAALLIEINKFIVDHAVDQFGLMDVVDFAAYETWVPKETAEPLFAALDKKHADDWNPRAYFLLARASGEKDETKKTTMLNEVVEKYPDSREAKEAGRDLFYTAWEKGLPERDRLYAFAAEKNPDVPELWIYMARTYMNANVKLPEALALLGDAEQIVKEYANKPFAGHFPHDYVSLQQKSIAVVRAGIYLKMGKPGETVAILGPRRGEFKLASSFYLLGQGLEGTGDFRGAVDCYLEAAVRPWSEQKEADAKLEALWRREKMGSKRELQRRMEEVGAREAVKDAYVPRLLRHAAPQFEVTTLRGEHFSNGELKGKVAVVNLWATWCAACLEELPALQEFQEKHPEVVVLTVVEKDTNEKDLRGVIREKKLKMLRIGEAPFEMWQQFGAFGVPNTFVVDKDGNVRTQHNGMADVSRYLTADLQAIGAASN